MKSKPIIKIIVMALALCLSLGVLSGCNEDAGSGNNTTTPAATTTAGNDDTQNNAGNDDTQNNAGNNDTQNNTENNNAEDNTNPATADPLTGAIAVITREDGSGTRGAFVELFDVRIENAEGKKVDDIRQDAQIQNSTGSVITSVQGNKQAIGYISLGSLDDTVKALQINGVDATVENIINGSYTISRPFNIVHQPELSDAAQDFIDFIMSDEGQAVVIADKYISESSTGAYGGGGLSGKVTIEGSSSVSPVMQKIIEAYNVLNPDVTVELQTNDSSTGVRAAIDGAADIGMASRDVNADELAQGITAIVICLDGIAIIVNTENGLNNVSVEDIRAIFQDGGNITKWEDIS